MLAAVGHVQERWNQDGREARVEEVRVSRERLLELGGTCHNEASDVWPVDVDKELRRELANFADVIVPLFETQPSKPQGGLTAAAMLFRQVHAELVQNFPVVALHKAIERPVTVHDDEAEPVVAFEELRKVLRVKFVVAHIHCCVDRLERLEVDRHFFFLAILGLHLAAIEDEPIGRRTVVALQTLLRRRDGGQHRKPVHARLDARRRARLLRQHLVREVNVLLAAQDERDGGRASTSRIVQCLD
mmetsp:Transcript_49517/g.138652  ORF Transcript_49517/g.138652 Transcript_49517/m.138652 type:complete len:245 (+) Transcript_49517:661-1395(+)